MPCGDGTGPRWAQGRWRHCIGVGRGYRQREPVNLTKEEQRKILEAEINEIEAEKQEIEKRLNELK